MPSPGLKSRTCNRWGRREGHRVALGQSCARTEVTLSHLRLKRNLDRRDTPRAAQEVINCLIPDAYL